MVKKERRGSKDSVDPSKSIIDIQLFAFSTLFNIMKKPYHTSMVMAPAELSLLYAMKGSGPKQGKEEGCDWSASGDRFTGKLSSGCLADTRQSH